jgi:hypothetical protein
MSNDHSVRRAPVGTAVEALEGRTLFVATPGPSFAAILSHVQETAASHLRLAEHAELSAINLSAAKQAAVDAAKSGKTLLAADKAALKGAVDEAAKEAAAQKLDLDKTQTKADLLEAKTNVRTLQAEAKAATSSLKAALKEDRALLSAELKSSDAGARKAVNKLINDWQAMQIGSDLTSQDMQTLADHLKLAADGATQPSAESVSTLRGNALIALADGDFSQADADALSVDLRNVFLSSDISAAEADVLIEDVSVIIDKILLPPGELAVIVHDLQIALAAFSGE